LDALHLQRTSLVADIGAGTGYFSVWIAKRIPEGKYLLPIWIRTFHLGERARLERFASMVCSQVLPPEQRTSSALRPVH